MSNYGSNHPYGLSAYKDDGPVPRMDTVFDVIKRALRLFQGIQPGETPSAQQSHDALQQLNWMLDLWNNEKNIQPYEKTEQFTLVAGKSEYYIGQGTTADFVTERPLKINRAYTRITNAQPYTIDYPLNIISTEQYEGIVTKNLAASWPMYLNYTLTDMPTGRIRIFPIPSANSILGLCYDKQLSGFNSVSDQITLPPGYLDALATNLAVRLAPEWGLEVSPEVKRMAVRSKQLISGTNSEPVLLEPLRGRGKPIYNVFVDGYVN